jgi:hypothetical protein
LSERCGETPRISLQRCSRDAADLWMQQFSRISHAGEMQEMQQRCNAASPASLLHLSCISPASLLHLSCIQRSPASLLHERCERCSRSLDAANFVREPQQFKKKLLLEIVTQLGFTF